MTFGDRRAAFLDKLPASVQSWVQLQRVGTMEEVYQVAQNFVRVHNLDRHINRIGAAGPLACSAHYRRKAASSCVRGSDDQQ